MQVECGACGVDRTGSAVGAYLCLLDWCEWLVAARTVQPCCPELVECGREDNNADVVAPRDGVDGRAHLPPESGLALVVDVRVMEGVGRLPAVSGGGLTYLFISRRHTCGEGSDARKKTPENCFATSTIRKR